MRRDSLAIGGGHASAVGRDWGVNVTGGGTTQLAGDAQQGCCTPREEAGPPRRGFIRGTAGRTKDDCDAHRHLGTDGTGACGARPGRNGCQEGDTGLVGQTPISPAEPMQGGCWREMGRPPVLAKSSLKQHHTRWPQEPPSGTAHPSQQAAQQSRYKENLPHQTL